MFKDVGKESVLVSQVVGILRNKKTEPSEFRSALKKLGVYLAYEASKLLDKTTQKVESPLGIANYDTIGDRIVVISILRAALPMSEGVIDQFSRASVGVVSASRGKMLEEKGKAFRIDASYTNFPYLDKDNIAIIVDPMLASGSTMLLLLKMVTQQNPKSIIILTAIASQYGINRVKDNYPEVIILAGSIDDELDEKGYIVPGLGDAGDRAFNT